MQLVRFSFTALCGIASYCRLIHFFSCTWTRTPATVTSALPYEFSFLSTWQDSADAMKSGCCRSKYTASYQWGPWSWENEAVMLRTWFQASTAMHMRSAAFRNITRRWVVVLYWSFLTRLDHWRRDGQVVPTSVQNYHSALQNIPEEYRSQVVLQAGFEKGISQKQDRVSFAPATRKQTDKRRVCVSCPNIEHRGWCSNDSCMCVYLGRQSHATIYITYVLLWQLISAPELRHRHSTSKNYKMEAASRCRNGGGDNVPSSFFSFSNDIRVVWLITLGGGG
jgi:hypothetical protein